MHYRRTKRDANHKAVVGVLHEAGASVVDLAMLGGGVNDLLVGFRGVNKLLEVKNPERKTRGGKTGAEQATKDRQETFRLGWRGDPPVVVYNGMDALVAIGAVHPLSAAHATRLNIAMHPAA